MSEQMRQSKLRQMIRALFALKGITLPLRDCHTAANAIALVYADKEPSR